MIPFAAAVDLIEGGVVHQKPSNLVVLVGEFSTFQHRIIDRNMDESVPLLEVYYYLSTDTEIDAGDTLVLTEKTQALTDPTDGFIGINFQIPTNMTGGLYYLLWSFPFAQDEEVRDNIGHYATRYKVVAPTDFDYSVDSASAGISATQLSPGDGFTATGGVFNQGPDAADGYVVKWYLSVDQTIGNTDDVLLGHTQQNGVGPPVGGNPIHKGFLRNLTIPSTTPPGNYYLGLRIVAVRDSNQNNNVYRFFDKIEVLDPTPGFADLKLAGASSVAIGTTRPPNDGTLAFSARVRNTGNKNSTSYRIEYYARPTSFNNSNGDILLYSVQYPELEAAPFGSTSFPTQDISVDLPMFNLVTTLDYYIFWKIVGGNDSNTSNNAYLFQSSFRPSNRPDLNVSNVRLRSENGTDTTSFVAFNRYPIRFSGELHNATLRDQSYVYEIRFQRRGANNTNYSGIYSGEEYFYTGRYYLPGEGPDRSPRTIPGNATRNFDFSIPLQDIRSADGSTSIAFDISWWQNSFTTPTYDVTFRVLPLSPSQIPLIDASPNDNKAEFVMTGERSLYNLTITSKTFTTPTLPQWNIHYGGGLYPEITVTAEARSTAGPDTARVALQLYANGTPIGARGAYFSLAPGERSNQSITRQIPSTFPTGPVEITLGLVYEPGYLPDPFQGDDTIVYPEWVNVGSGDDGRADLIDGGPGLHNTPVALTPGSSNSALGFSIRNTGLTDAPASFVEVYLSTDDQIGVGSDILIGLAPVDPIVAGGNTAVELQLSVPELQLNGNYYIGWKLNARGNVSPENSLNNTVIAKNQVTIATARNLTYWATPFALSTETAKPGDTIPFTGSRQNNGNADIGAHHNAVQLSTDPFFLTDVTTITSSTTMVYIDGETPRGFRGLISPTFDLPADLPRGVYHCRYVFDVSNRIEEINEHDNIAPMGMLRVLGEGEFGPKILALRKLPSDYIFIRWTSRSDRNYHIQTSPDLSGPWQTIDPAYPIPGEEGATQFSPSRTFHTQLQNPTFFFRIQEVAP